jgi:prepilin-type N-terminal cleavage/methylation domain-containing protein
MKSSFSFNRGERGFTIVELMVASTVLTVISLAVFSGSIAIQRSYQASQKYVISQASQSRLIDYIGVDLRRATSVSVPDSSRIELWIPDFYKADGSPNDPQFVRNSAGRLAVQYGGAPVHIAYYIERPADSSNGTLWREENGVKAAIATEVRDFLPVFERSADAADASEQVFKLSVTFAPRFQWSGDGSSARNGTAASTRILLRNKKPR